MQNENMYKVIIDVLEHKLKVNPNMLVLPNFNVPLTGRMFGLCARDLVYLFFEIEKKFNVKIGLENLVNGEFNTITGIYELIERIYDSSMKAQR